MGLSKSKFFLRQWQQIKAGGPRTIWQKIKAATRRVLLTSIAPVVIDFNLDWPEAFDFWIAQSLRKTKMLWMQAKDKSEINSGLDTIIAYLAKSTQKAPSLSFLQRWMQRRLMMGSLYWLKGDMEQCLSIHEITAHVRRQVLEKHGLDQSCVEFIPRSLAAGAIGVYEYLEILLKAGTLGLGPHRQKILLLDPDTKVNNPCFLKYWGQYVTIVRDRAAIDLFTGLEQALTSPMFVFIELEGKSCMTPWSLGRIREQWIKERRPPLLKLTEEDHERGREVLKSWGLSPRDWFVALHVREAGWKDQGTVSDNFRNADIGTYSEAIKLITEAGGWVIRIGDPTMKKIADMPHVVDYAHSGDKSDWMDIFLCSQCRFMIATSSGMSVVASASGVPLIVTNMLPASSVSYFTSQDLFLLRHCFSDDLKRYLTFEELMSAPVATGFTQADYVHRHLRVLENTPEELKDIVQEMMDRFSGAVEYTSEDEALQNEFRALAAQCAPSFGNKGVTAQVHARIGRDFLRKYASLMPQKTAVGSSMADSSKGAH